MSLIKRKLVRAFMLEYAAKNRAHKFSRISPAVYEEVESAVRETCRKIVHSQPSKGKTIK